ncbi:hypothetical protein ACT3QV_004481 [Vibrio alginolyticus]
MRKVHIHMDIKPLLQLDDKQFSETVNHPDGPAAAREDLQEMLNRGITKLVCDRECDNRDQDGSCAGHEVD